METQAPVASQATGQTPALFAAHSAPLQSTVQSANHVEAARAAAEVHAMMLLAKQFPRDETRAFAKIIEACKRKGLAERALYAFPRGGSHVSGPSINLLKVIAAAWGNLRTGWKETERRDGESTVIAYCWDLETNYSAVREVVVPHVNAKGRRLDDEADIYLTIANMAARRQRACMEAVIPPDVVQAAEDQINLTQAGDQDGPLADRVRAMVVAFGELSITQEMLEKRLGHPVTAVVNAQLVQLKRIYASLRDGMSKREDWFDLAATAPSSAASALTERLKPSAAAKPVAPAPPVAKAAPAARPPVDADLEPPPIEA